MWGLPNWKPIPESDHRLKSGIYCTQSEEFYLLWEFTLFSNLYANFCKNIAVINSSVSHSAFQSSRMGLHGWLANALVCRSGGQRFYSWMHEGEGLGFFFGGEGFNSSKSTFVHTYQCLSYLHVQNTHQDHWHINFFPNALYTFGRHKELCISHWEMASTMSFLNALHMMCNSCTQKFYSRTANGKRTFQISLPHWLDSSLMTVPLTG